MFLTLIGVDFACGLRPAYENAPFRLLPLLIMQFQNNTVTKLETICHTRFEVRPQHHPGNPGGELQVR